MDGGLIANNPTLDALSEIHEHHLALRAVGREEESVPVSVVVSLGTGMIPVTPVKGIDVFLPGGIMDSIKLYSGIQTLSTVVVDQVPRPMYFLGDVLYDFFRQPQVMVGWWIGQGHGVQQLESPISGFLHKCQKK